MSMELQPSCNQKRLKFPGAMRNIRMEPTEKDMSREMDPGDIVDTWIKLCLKLVNHVLFNYTNKLFYVSQSWVFCF